MKPLSGFLGSRAGRGALAAALFVLLPGRAAGAESLELEYQIYVGGLRSLSLEATLTLRPQSPELATGATYDLAVAMRSENLFGIVNPYTLEARSSGRADPQGVRPQRFAFVSERRAGLRSVRIDYGPNGGLTLESSGPPAGDPEEQPDPVPEGLRKATLDPISAVFALVDGVFRRGSCGGRLPVFDGSRRYDLSLRATGLEQLPSNALSIFSGPASRCEVLVEPIAGFPARAVQPGRLPRMGDVWLAAALPDQPPVPVRIHTESRLGGVRVHLVGARLVAEAPAPGG